MDSHNNLLANLDQYISETSIITSFQKQNNEIYSKIDDLNDKIKHLKTNTSSFSQFQTELKNLKEEIDLRVTIDEFNEQMKEKASKSSISTALHRKANKNDIELALTQKVDTNTLSTIELNLSNKVDMD